MIVKGMGFTCTGRSTSEHEFTIFDVMHTRDETLPEGVFILEYDADITIIEDEDSEKEEKG